MQDLFKKFENLWVSVAFAESGEHEAMQQILIEEALEEANGKACPAL